MSAKSRMDTQEFETGQDRENSDQKEIISLTVVGGEEIDFARTYKFRDFRQIRVGRSGGNDIVLNDPKVSAVHASLSVSGRREKIERVILEDLDSTNGTWVNNQKVSRITLKHGDKITVGQTILWFSLKDPVGASYHSRLFRMAIMDNQTGLFNRRYLLQVLQNTFTVAKRHGRDLSLILFDIDNFKQVNDTFGHVAGDEYLRIVGGVLKNSLREQDICGRYGGEEFILMLPETGPSGARQVGEKVRMRIQQLKVSYQNREIMTTISGGIAWYESSVVSVEEMIARADRALYEAKSAGKNRVCG